MEMMRLLLFGAFLVATVASCSMAPSVELINGSGRDLVLRLPRDVPEGWAARDDLVRVAPGKSDVFMTGRIDARGLRLSSGGCDYRYAMPRLVATSDMPIEQSVDPKAPWSHNPVAVEVGPDFAIYLSGLSQGHIVPARDLALAQGYGFPVRPVSKTCR
jgi:hypothetical protein